MDKNYNLSEDNIELFYNVFSESCNYLYEITHANYFQLFKMTAQNIFAGEVLNDFEDDEIKQLQKIYEPLIDKEFNCEEVRKALQAQVLRCLRDVRRSNGETTPDSLGMIIVYLISKLFNNYKELSILDPLVGSGNLLFTIYNHLTIDTALLGCDNDEDILRLTKSSADLLSCPISLYLQDTLSLKFKSLDLITFDFPINFDTTVYYPYKCILKYLTMLNDKGYLIGILPKDLLKHDKNKNFINELEKESQLLGIIDLPSNFFKSNEKAIFIFKKKKLKDKKCFVVKFTDFKDLKSFNETLSDLESWFIENQKILNEGEY